MVAKVFLLSSKSDDISEFLYKFYDKEIDIDNSMSWTSDFLNPVDLAEIIAAFVDNISNFDINFTTIFYKFFFSHCYIPFLNILVTLLYQMD